MRFSEITNRSQLESIGEIWYQRASKLSDIFMNEDESFKRVVKAYKLWNILNLRMAIIIQQLIIANIPKPTNLDSGGVNIKPKE